MGPAVVTAVLLLVGIINSVTALNNQEAHKMCSHQHIHMYGDFWTSYNQGRVMRYFDTPKTFQEAKAQCNSIHSELVSVHNQHQMNNAVCMSMYFSATRGQHFWIGAQRSGSGFKNEDGTEFKFTNWSPHQPDNARGTESCIEANFGGLGKWNDLNCKTKRAFLCVKKTAAICSDEFNQCLRRQKMN
ncbi:C-type isolectin Sp-CL4-like [Pseudoliparis swirei]|uniref:C-type isolectin Sp-CL4-like n=1 Tax=Pseudoliparis swirei TaxID=2059687 RepID=UPI0024BEDFF0|nr:C-type isolectin Sp-CL4-like [Pseudoliparis swirei]